MEPPPFHHHHHNNRYAPVAPPRISGDRNFYHHHQQHQHQHHHLPPPPPPPAPPPTQPPLPSLYHHHQRHASQYPFPNSHPIIEGDPRRQHPFDVERPPRAPVSDRIVFDHHRQNPFPDDHSHLPDAWDPPPPRVPPQLPRTFPVNWENEPPRNHFSAHPMSPYRSASDGNFNDRKRFVDDQESGSFREYPIDGFERNQNDEIFYNQSDNRVSTSGSSHSNYFRNRISFENTVSSRNHAQSAGNHGMNFNFESDNGRSRDGRGAGDCTDERRIWVSTRPNSRDADTFVNGIEMREKEIMGEDDIRVGSGKRFPYITKMGKFNNRVGNEGSQEIVHTPKKKPQKLSALQRIQLGKTTPRKLHSSAYFDDSNSGSFRSKGPLVFSDHRLEEEIVSSSVELDVSFKSNSLVAKQVVAPSSPVVGSNGSSTPKTKRIKKAMTPVSVSSNSRLTELHEGPVSGDGSSLGVRDASSSDKGPMQLEEKHTVSDTGVMDDVGSQPRSSGVNLSIGKSAKEGFPGAMTSTKATIDINVSHDGRGTAKIKKKRKITASRSSLSSSQASEIHKEPINANQSTSGGDASLSPDKDRMCLQEKLSISTVQEIENVNLQPCPNAATVLLEKDAVQGSVVAVVSEKEDIKVVFDVEVAPNLEKIMKDMGPFPGLSSSQVSEIHEGPVDTNSSLRDADFNLDASKNLSHLDGRGTVSDAMPANDVDSHGYTDGCTALLEGSVVEVSPEVRIEMTGDANVVSDGACTHKSSEKTKVKSPPPACLRSRSSESHEKPVNGDSSMDCVDAVSSSDKVPVDSAEKVPVSGTGTVGDIGKQLCPNVVGVSLGNSPVKGSPEATNSVIGVQNVESNAASTHKIKRKRKVQVLKIHGGLARRKSSNNSEDPTSSLDNVRSQSKEKCTVSDIGSVGNATSLPCSNGIAVTDEIITVKRSPKAVNSAKRVLNVNSDGMCVPNIKRQRKGLDSLLDLSSSQAPDTPGGPINTGSSIHDSNATTGSENVPVCSEQKVAVSYIGYVDGVALKPCPNEVSVLLEHSLVKESPMDIDSVKESTSESITKLEHPSADSSSFVEESAVLDLQFQCLSGSRGEHPDNAIPSVSMSSCQECPHQDNILGKESGRGRELQTEKDASQVDCMLGRENSKDTSVLHPQVQGQLGGVSLDIRTSCLDDSPSSTAMEGNASNNIMKDECLSTSDYLSLNIISDPNGERMESVPDRSSKIESPGFLSTFPEICILNAEQSLTNISNENIHWDNNKPDEKIIVKDASTLNTHKICVFTPDVNMRSHKKIHTDGSITEKRAPFTSQGTRQSPNPKLTVGELNGKKISGTAGVPRAFQSRSSLVAGSFNDKAPSTCTANSRTWQRTDNPFASLTGKKSISSASPSQRQSPKKFGKVQSTSYIRKGNSLVRKGAPNAAFPQGSHNLSTAVNQLSAVDRDKTKKVTASECKGNSFDPLSCPRKGGANPSFESPKTPPLPHSSKSQNSTTKSSQDCVYHSLNNPLSEGGSEATSVSTKVTENEDVFKHAKTSENQASLSNNLGIQSTLKDGNSQSSKMNIVYVKHKSNQLVAASSPGIRDPSFNVPEKTQALSSSISSDCYYKRSKNQLVRNVQIPGSQVKQSVAVNDDSSNSEGQRVSTVPSLKCSRSLSKRRPHKGLGKACKSSKFSWVWTLHGTNSENDDKKALQCQKVWPYIFPWKRMAYRKHCRYDSVSMSNRSSSSFVSRKLLLSRKRDTVYTRSTGGFSLRKSKVLSIGGSNLKWSKSIEKRSKKVNEEATLAVVAAERKKREQKGASAIASAKNRNQSSRKSGHSIELRPGERVFRIGFVRYKMDPSKRTLQRIADEKSGVDPQSGKDTRKSVVPRRLLIGNDEYVRIGNGNQLIRDPKKLIRFLASEKIRWSLHTARLRLARKQQYCQFFTRFGKCNKDDGKCPYIHDPSKVAVCTKFLKGLCDNTDCKLTHKVIPERMQDCSYFLQGLCTNENCPYRHVNVNPSAPVCKGFLRGYCVDGDECRKKHSYVCPVFEATGICPQGSMCKLHHPKNQNKDKKRKRSKDRKNKRGRYFRSRLTDATKNGRVASDKPAVQNTGDIFFLEERLVDYIRLDVSDEEAGETTNVSDMHTTLCDSEPSELTSDDLGDLIKPVRILNRNLK
ncbi:uncharacterized protein LOC122664886 isoform X2 [Telopea speciosissima]|uniref:uncharacterized protein LOC122664886 isoform X2 n=1 Tax=Telopea speciosissima TaxID=54955 RepID=UPI001CC478B2|nr:uncharacterized protein LOC122664886 isoform X2 [Telopea speciosissima]